MVTALHLLFKHFSTHFSKWSQQAPLTSRSRGIDLAGWSRVTDCVTECPHRRSPEAGTVTRSFSTRCQGLVISFHPGEFLKDKEIQSK